MKISKTQFSAMASVLVLLSSYTTASVRVPKFKADVPAAETFLNGIPAASIYTLLEGLKEAGVNAGELGISRS